MPTQYREFDRSRLKMRPLAERIHDLHLDHWLQLTDATPPFTHPGLSPLKERLTRAKENGAARILMMGAHLLRAGVSRHIIELLRSGWIDHIATNGAGMIHDYELARIGATTESVARYIRSGEFGLWSETGELNEGIASAPARPWPRRGRRRLIANSGLPYRDLSIAAAAGAKSTSDRACRHRL